MSSFATLSMLQMGTAQVIDRSTRDFFSARPLAGRPRNRHLPASEERRHTLFVQR
jgi:hypothetical protein